MKTTILSVAIGLITFSGAYAQSSDSVQRMASPRIVNGKPAVEGDWPSIAAITDSSNDHFCGGSYIGGRYVLTAAHCLTYKSIESFKVHIGAYDLKDLSESSAKAVSSFYIHPEYNGTTYQNDIAIIELSDEVDSNIEPMKLASENEISALSADTTKFTAIGWGSTLPAKDENSKKSYENELRQVKLPLVHTSTCQNLGGDYSYVDAYSICAGYADGSADTCFGDSGGPLIETDGGAHKQVGIVSWGDGCAQKDSYGVYSNVGYFNTNGWIERNTSGVSHSPDILLKEKSGIYEDKIEVRNLIPDDNFTHKLNVKSVELPQGVTLLNNNCSAELEYGDTCIIDIRIDASTVYANSDKAMLKVITDHQISSELPISIVYSYEDRNVTTYQPNNSNNTSGSNNGKDGGGSTSVAMLLLAMFGFGLRAKRQR